MNIYEFGTKPIQQYYGEPAKDCGEWPGIKPCGFFTNTFRKIIRPVNHDLFNVSGKHEEDLFKPRKHILPKSSSCEEVLRGIKIVKQPDHGDRIFGIRCHYPEIKAKELLPDEKKHYFPYRIEKEQNILKRRKNLSESDLVKEEMNFIQKIGYKKKPLVFNWEINAKNARIKKGNKFGDMFKDDHIDFSKTVYKDTFRTKQLKKLNKMRRVASMQDVMKDIKYVKNLQKWEEDKFGKKKKN